MNTLPSPNNKASAAQRNPVLPTVALTLLALALALGHPLPAQGIILEIGRAGSSAHAIALAGPFAYVVDDGFAVYDISDAMNPLPTSRPGSGGNGGGAIALSARHAFVGTANDGVSVYDLSDPANPNEISQLPQVGRPLSLAFSDNHLFIGTSQQSVRIFNLEDPASPVPLGQINTGNSVVGIAITGSHALLAAQNQGLLIFDVSDPSAPVQRPQTGFGGSANSVVVVGSLAYLANGQDGLRILDISDPASPQAVGHLPARNSTTDVAVDGDRAYLVDRPSGLVVVDISDFSSPQVIDSFNSGQNALTVATADDVIYLGTDLGGLHALIQEETPPPPTPDKFTTGSLTVIIEPEEADADGARWSVHGRPNRASGFREDNLAPGHHDIRFKDLPGWRESLNFNALVAGGGEMQVTATFAPVPNFYFKAVPDQEARHGETLEFFVHTDDPTDPQNPGPGATLEVTTEPQPEGQIALDAATGHFTYAPGELDRLPFTFTFTAGGQEATAIITPRPVLAAEESVIQYDRPLPDEESRDYIHITETWNTEEHFNDSIDPIPTLNVDISGKTLVFEQGHPASLLPAYDDRTDIKQMNLYAERVIIRSPIRWPQTHVTVHARELRFEGDGQIDTTPRARKRKPKGAVYGDGLTQGRTGDPGLQGGDIDVFVERFHAEGSESRFVMRGGKGGPAGEGRNGQTHEDLLQDDDGNRIFPIDSLAWRNLMSNRGVGICDVRIVFGRLTAVTYETHFSIQNNPPLTVLCGVDDPPRGENAIRSGRPGAGGAGGTLHSTVNLASYAVFDGGEAGAKGSDYVGGTLFGPFAHASKQLIDGKLRTGYQTIISQPGNSASALPPTSPFGPGGRATLEPNHDAWLHSFALRSIVQFARDAYLNGRASEARELLAEYHDIVSAIHEDAPDPDALGDAAFAELVNLNQILLEIDTLIHRIDSNLDYFGNPAGWVPMLSFEANLQAFRNEVDQSIPVLYLSYWLTHAADDLQNSTAASSAVRDKLENELDAMEAQFNEAQESIPRFKSIAEDLKIKIAFAQSRLAQIEQQLKLRAEQNLEDKNKLPLWKKALGTLSVAAHLIPVGQPVVGKIGTGLGLIGQLDPDDPLSSAATVAPKAIEAFSQKDISVCFKSSGTTNETKKARLERLSNCGKFLGGELKQLADLFKSSQVDKTELEAELARIKALDPAFKEITEEIAELNKQKEEFALKLDTALQAIASLTGAMGQNLAATHEIEQRLANNLAALDHNALLHVKEMERRAKDRLLKQQYFLAQAFQYRTLKPYGGTFQINNLFEQFQTLVEASADHTLSAAQFENLKALYIDEIQQITQDTLDNFNAPELAQSIQFQLNVEELEQLNENGKTTIQLKDRLRFSDTDENIRLTDIRTTQMQVEPVGGDIGTLATLSVKFKHLGVSRLTSKGKTFLFRHYQTEEVNPIVWQTSYDGLDDTFSNSTLAPAEQSLLTVLLGPAATTENLLLYSRPAAFAEIEITKDAITDNGIDLVIGQLRLRVAYEYETEGIARPELNVRVSGDLHPVIAVSQPDINGRQDGIGDFNRIYQPFTSVTLEAPASYGALPFERWIVNGAEQPTGLTAVTISLEQADKLAEARYQAAEASILPPEIVVQPQGVVAVIGTTAMIEAIVTGGEPMLLQWHKDGNPVQDSARISGANSATLDLTDLQATDSGGYSLVASNAGGVVTSQQAILAVTAGTLTTLDAGPGNVGFQFDTVAGFRYTIERKLTLADPEWTPVEVRTGTGSPMQFTRPTTANATAYFRLRVDAEVN